MGNHHGITPKVLVDHYFKKRGKLSQLWNTDYFAGILVGLVGLVLHRVSDFFGTLEPCCFDSDGTSTARQPFNRIAIITVDD